MVLCPVFCALVDSEDDFLRPGMVVHVCNSTTWELEAEGLGVQTQPELHSETLYGKQNKTERLLPQL
jgi:hypothetical protein